MGDLSCLLVGKEKTATKWGSVPGQLCFLVDVFTQMFLVRVFTPMFLVDV